MLTCKNHLLHIILLVKTVFWLSNCTPDFVIVYLHVCPITPEPSSHPIAINYSLCWLCSL